MRLPLQQTLTQLLVQEAATSLRQLRPWAIPAQARRSDPAASAPGATLCDEGSRCSEEPPLAATRESLHAATKTQCSQKEKRKYINKQFFKNEGSSVLQVECRWSRDYLSGGCGEQGNGHLRGLTMQSYMLGKPLFFIPQGLIILESGNGLRIFPLLCSKTSEFTCESKFYSPFLWQGFRPEG